jgi:hypothetical protein
MFSLEVLASAQGRDALPFSPIVRACSAAHAIAARVHGVCKASIRAPIDCLISRTARAAWRFGAVLGYAGGDSPSASDSR